MAWVYCKDGWTVERLLEDKGERNRGRPRWRWIDEDDFDLMNMAVKMENQELWTG